jgi:hypothetical protein
MAASLPLRPAGLAFSLRAEVAMRDAVETLRSFVLRYDVLVGGGDQVGLVARTEEIVAIGEVLADVERLRAEVQNDYKALWEADYARIEAALALHVPIRLEDGECCSECQAVVKGRWVPASWPCLTVKALRGETMRHAENEIDRLREFHDRLAKAFEWLKDEKDIPGAILEEQIDHLLAERERLRAALSQIVSDGHEQFDGECLSACAACIAEEALRGGGQRSTTDTNSPTWAEGGDDAE